MNFTAAVASCFFHYFIDIQFYTVLSLTLSFEVLKIIKHFGATSKLKSIYGIFLLFFRCLLYIIVLMLLNFSRRLNSILIFIFLNFDRFFLWQNNILNQIRIVINLNHFLREKLIHAIVVRNHEFAGFAKEWK